MARRNCKHESCARCEELSLPPQTSDWYVCCRCRELKRRDDKPRKAELMRLRGAFVRPSRIVVSG